MPASKSRNKHVANISVTFDMGYDQILVFAVWVSSQYNICLTSVEHRDPVWRQYLVILF